MASREEIAGPPAEMRELRLAVNARIVSHQPISGDIPDSARKMKALAILFCN
jgi:hypothetical protein